MNPCTLGCRATTILVLDDLKTRDDDDFSIALLDASAVVLDVLSFYQERLANEAYLRTAQQLRSLTELSRLIGDEPSPGVAASTYAAAFTITAVRGKAPSPSIAPSIIPQGTQVQGVPPPGQAPQIFETAADIRAKADWNALPVETGVPWVAPNGTSVSISPEPRPSCSRATLYYCSASSARHGRLTRSRYPVTSGRSSCSTK